MAPGLGLSQLWKLASDGPVQERPSSLSRKARKPDLRHPLIGMLLGGHLNPGDRVGDSRVPAYLGICNPQDGSHVLEGGVLRPATGHCDS